MKEDGTLSENRAAGEDSKARENRCHHERHLSGIALKVYNLFWRLSKKSKTGSISITNQRIAQLIGAKASERADHITRVKTALVRGGLFEFLGVSRGSKSGTWRGGRYQPVSHEDWAEMKMSELGHSPCHPAPLQIKVSEVKPGGRSFQRKGQKKAPLGGPEVRTVAGEKQSRGAGQEVRTDCVVGSTHGLRRGKYAQSVDFEPAVDVDVPRSGNRTSSSQSTQKSAAASSKAFKGEGTSSPLPSPTPLRKPTNRNTNQLGAWRGMGSTRAEIALQLERRGETIADYLADRARARCRQSAEYEKYLDERNVDRLWEMGQISYYKNSGSIRRYSANELQLFTSVFAGIGYQFAWDNPLLGFGFCENVRYVVEESRAEFPRPKKGELCERVLDHCEKSWSELGEYCDVGLPYCPPDFNDHIKRLFELEEK
jgi:hypothetical protein